MGFLDLRSSDRGWYRGSSRESIAKVARIFLLSLATPLQRPDLPLVNVYTRVLLRRDLSAGLTFRWSVVYDPGVKIFHHAAVGADIEVTAPNALAHIANLVCQVLQRQVTHAAEDEEADKPGLCEASGYSVMIHLSLVWHSPTGATRSGLVWKASA